MLKFHNHIRTPNKRIPFSKACLPTLFSTCLGLTLGVIAKLLDIYTTNLGNLFSQMSVWIFLCTLLSISSSTPKRAAGNVFFFCIGMLAAYYATAIATESVYSSVFAYGWTIVSLFSPVFAICAWYAKGTGWIAKAMTGVIIASVFGIALFLFDKIRMSDVVFAVLIGIFLLKKDKEVFG